MHCAHTVADLMSMAPRRQHPHRYLASCCIWHLFAHALSHFYSCLGYRVTRTTCCFKRVADLLFCLAFIFPFITVNVQGAIFSATDRRDDYLAVLLAERYVNAPLLRVRTFSRMSIACVRLVQMVDFYWNRASEFAIKKIQRKKFATVSDVFRS